MRETNPTHGSPADRAAAILAMAARAAQASPEKAAERLTWTPEKGRAMDLAFEAKRQRTQAVLEAALRRLKANRQGGTP